MEMNECRESTGGHNRIRTAARDRSGGEKSILAARVTIR
jgi:hypothetical protein